MNTRLTLVSLAAILMLSQLPMTASAQTQNRAAPAMGAPEAPAKTPVASMAAKQPTDWIEYDDITYTPVVDDVSAHLAAARAALARKDNMQASEAMRAAARALEAQAGEVAKIDNRRAAIDTKQASEVHRRMSSLAKKLDVAAAQIKAGELTTTVALDKTLNEASRADLEQRWLVTDVTTWYPVAQEPQRHFGGAIEDFAKKDYKGAASEVRKAAAYVRLESARATGDAKKDLNAAAAELQRTARALDHGTVKSEKDLDRAFANANHALALAHRAKAVQSWGLKAYDKAGYELEAAAHGLESAASWTGAQAKSAASGAAADARALGEKLASGGVWTKDEVGKGFESLGSALNRLGETIGAKTKAEPFDAGD